MSLFKKFLTIIMLTLSASAWAQSLPSMPTELQGKTITMLIPWPPGGDTDMIQRYVANQVTKISGLNIVVVNRGGARGIIGARALLESKPDGLTVMGHANETHIINPVFEDQAVDSSGIKPVTIYAYTPQFLYTGIDSGIRNVDDIVRAAKKDPKFAIGCVIVHQCVYINQLLNYYGIKPYKVMFKSVAEMGMSAARGEIALFGAGATGGFPLVQGGRVRAVAVGWDRELQVYPDAQALGTIITGYRAYNLQMLSVPAGTPDHIVEYYNAVFRAAVKMPETVARFNEFSVIPADYSTKQVEQKLRTELALMKKSKQFAE